MSKAENKEQIDADILQCKADILRARDIIPRAPATSEKEPHEETKSKKTDENTTQSADVIEISTEKEKTSREGTSPLPIKPTEPAKTPQDETEIPTFDLAEDIMAEQRKVTAIRRKAPGKKTEAQKQEAKTKPTDYTIEQPPPVRSDRTQIITKIVARDIKRLCGDGA